MDPSISIDLSSVAGVVALTLIIINYLKAPIGRVTFLQELPLSVYVIGVSGGLTYLAHDVLHKLDGDLTSLITQAVMSALAASGAVEWWRAGSKPTADTQKALASRNNGLYVIPILLALGLSASCAKISPQLIAGEKTVRVVVLQVSEQVEPLVCNEEARKALTDKPCVQLLDALEPATDLAIAYNRALREGKAPAIAETIQAFQRLYDAIKNVVPDGPVKAAALQDLVLARVRVEGGK